MAAASVTILQFTDLHLLADTNGAMYGVVTDHAFRETLSAALCQHPQAQLLLLTGDLAEEPCQAVYRRLRDRLEATGIPALCVPGNHDDWSLMQDVLNGTMVSCAPSLLLDDWLIVTLNSVREGSPQGYFSNRARQQLLAQLWAHPERMTLIATHHPCVSVGSPWMDRMGMDNGEQLLRLLAHFPQVKAIVHGHAHQACAATYGELHVLGTPATCFQFMPGAASFTFGTQPPGYRWIELGTDAEMKSGAEYLPQ